MPATLTDRIDAVSRDLITGIKDLRDQAAELRARADGLDAEADDLRAELGDWNQARSYMLRGAALAEHTVSAMDRIAEVSHA